VEKLLLTTIVIRPRYATVIFKIKELIMNKLKIYSPNQILLGSFWGGPIAVVYFLYRNYILLNNHKYAKKTILLGSILILVLLGLLPFLPDKFPHMAIPLFYSLLGKQLASQTQLSKKDIKKNKNYFFESNWKVFGIGTLTLLIFLAIEIAIMFGLDYMGFINLTE